MPLSLGIWLFLFAVCRADGSGSSLRGAGPPPSEKVAENEASASEDSQVVSCSCDHGGACQCSRPDGHASQTAEDEELERSVLTRTKELMAWWQAQNETTRLMSQTWDSPIEEQTVELWHASATHWHAGGAHVHAGGSAVHVSGGGAHVSGRSAHVSGGSAHVSGGGAHVSGGSAHVSTSSGSGGGSSGGASGGSAAVGGGGVVVAGG